MSLTGAPNWPRSYQPTRNEVASWSTSDKSFPWIVSRLITERLSDRQQTESPLWFSRRDVDDSRQAELLVHSSSCNASRAVDVGGTALIERPQQSAQWCRTRIWVPGGRFRMGSDKHYPEEAPVHRVTVSDFWIDRTLMTPPAVPTRHSRKAPVHCGSTCFTAGSQVFADASGRHTVTQ